MIRLNKYLSICGVSSRRGADILITEGRVVVNDLTADTVGVVIDEDKDQVKVDGALVAPVDKKFYLILNKPRQVMTTLHDPFKRRTVVDCLKGFDHRVYPIGRLDFETTGVLLLTNDGDLTYRLAHPKYEVPKVYEALVEGQFTEAARAEIEYGIRLDDGKMGRAEVRVLGYAAGRTRVRLTLVEGRKREVRLLCKAVKFPVEKLDRVEFAGLTARGLKRGQWRELTVSELSQLRKRVELK